MPVADLWMRGRQRNSGFDVRVVVSHDFPCAAIFRENLQESRMERAARVSRYTWRTLRAFHRRQGLNDGHIGSDELQRDDLLLERAVLENSREDYLMLFEKGIVTLEILAADVGERSSTSEVLGVADGVAVVPRSGFILDDFEDRSLVLLLLGT